MSEKFISWMEHAALIAKAAHFGQTDKGGKPRFEHVRHVSNQCPFWIYKIVALLHDTIEDSPLTTIKALRKLFNDEIAEAVDAISRREGEKYFDYIERCKRNSIARVVKIEDIKHNSDRNRWPEMPDSYMKREVKALAILEAIGENA